MEQIGCVTCPVKMERVKTIPIHPGTPQGQSDPRTHYWYKSLDSEFRSICDDTFWPPNIPPRTINSDLNVPCISCRGLYSHDVAYGQHLFDLQPNIDYPTLFMVYSPQLLEDVPHKQEWCVEVGTLAMTAFARFFEATPQRKVTMVRDARLFQAEPLKYKYRAYYGAFRNALRQTHWKGTDLPTFEAKLDDVTEELRLAGRKGNASKRERYQNLGNSYVRFWGQYDDIELIRIPEIYTEIHTQIAGLKIRVSAELGVRISGVEYALDPYFRKPRPTKLFREATWVLTEQARQNTWDSRWTAAVYDVDRRIILPEPRITNPRDLIAGLEGAAANFLQIWKVLEIGP